jgi:hypothetical protein
MRLDLRRREERPGRAAPAALPPKDRVRLGRSGREAGADRRPRPNRLTCDVCGHARTRDERHRLVWERDPAIHLVLAELCRHCAAFADPLLEFHGGRGRDAIRLVRETRVAPPPRTLKPRVLAYAARGILYLLIAVGFFLLVTLVTSRGL